MAWFDDPAVYYKAAEGPITQGDIIVAPTTVLSLGEADEGIVGPSAIGDHRESRVWLANDKPFPAAPELKARTVWSLAIVVPHACSMEKEWNERIANLTAKGVPQEAAEAEATADETLDPFITIAPIVLYDSVTHDLHRGISTNQRLGNFPVCGLDNIPLSFADFNRITTIHYSLASSRSRISSLSELALSHMHHALAMHFAFRSQSGWQKIQAAVNSTITDVAVINRAKGRVVVNLILSNGTTLTLEGQPESTSATPVAERPPRT